MRGLIYIKQEAEVWNNEISASFSLQTNVMQTYVNDVTLSIDHDVSVVAIFDLKDVTSYRVARHGLYEIESGPLELDAIIPSILGLEESKQVVNLCSPHFVTRSCVRDDVDNSTLNLVNCSFQRTGNHYLRRVQWQ